MAKIKNKETVNCQSKIEKKTNKYFVKNIDHSCKKWTFSIGLGTIYNVNGMLPDCMVTTHVITNRQIKIYKFQW